MREALAGEMDFIESGHHIAGITGIAHGGVESKDKAGGGLREDTGLAPKLGGAIALAFDARGNGGIVSIDDFALKQAFALGQLPRLFGDLVMGLQGLAQVTDKAFTDSGAPLGSLLKMLLGVGGELNKGAARLQQLPFGLAHQLDKDVALSPALASKAAHDLV